MAHTKVNVQERKLALEARGQNKREKGPESTLQDLMQRVRTQGNKGGGGGGVTKRRKKRVLPSTAADSGTTQQGRKVSAPSETHAAMPFPNAFPACY